MFIVPIPSGLVVLLLLVSAIMILPAAGVPYPKLTTSSVYGKPVGGGGVSLLYDVQYPAVLSAVFTSAAVA